MDFTLLSVIKLSLTVLYIHTGYKLFWLHIKPLNIYILFFTLPDIFCCCNKSNHVILLKADGKGNQAHELRMIPYTKTHLRPLLRRWLREGIIHQPVNSQWGSQPQTLRPHLPLYLKATTSFKRAKEWSHRGECSGKTFTISFINIS